MSDTAAETKETPVVASPEKEVVCERKPAAKAEKEEVKQQENGNEHEDSHPPNGDAKEAEEEEEEEEEESSNSTENGHSAESTDVCSLPQKRKSEVSGDSTDSPATKEGATPEKKAKLEEKVENGEAEASA